MICVFHTSSEPSHWANTNQRWKLKISSSFLRAAPILGNKFEYQANHEDIRADSLPFAFQAITALEELHLSCHQFDPINWAEWVMSGPDGGVFKYTIGYLFSLPQLRVLTLQDVVDFPALAIRILTQVRTMKLFLSTLLEDFKLQPLGIVTCFETSNEDSLKLDHLELYILEDSTYHMLVQERESDYKPLLDVSQLKRLVFGCFFYKIPERPALCFGPMLSRLSLSGRPELLHQLRNELSNQDWLRPSVSRNHNPFLDQDEWKALDNEFNGGWVNLKSIRLLVKGGTEGDNGWTGFDTDCRELPDRYFLGTASSKKPKFTFNYERSR
ncbi:hypothetical protein CPB83DRAFT_879841 [Crepidotus variabilis]|uniref:Uncharacterized protein n=1 Tax=Crepidotus variabilis TaxID=179855 RepID=A0A9P6ESP4_9AGAR|nr:hypothetical protein CPB83DRAFT_879841 [Crepidotus variabilis]